jgi:hypothetical protein
MEVLMGKTKIDRRQLVRTAAGVAAGGVLVGGTSATAASASDSSSGGDVLGAWWVEHTNDPPADPEFGISVVSIGAGGIIVSNDIRPAGPVSNGAWAMHDDRFRATFWGSAPLGPDVEPGSVRIVVRGRLRNGKLVGTFAVTGYDADGEELFSGTGTFSGTRISP